MMSLINRKKRPDAEELAEATTSTNLFKKDYEKIEQRRKRVNKRHAEYVRDLIRDALIEDKLATPNSSAEAASTVATDALFKQGLEPLLQQLQDIHGCMQELALMRGNESPLNGESFGAFIDELNKCLGGIHDNTENRYSEFVRIAKLLHDRQERAERWGEAAYVLSGHSFNAVLALSDLFRRYVLIPQISALSPQDDAMKVAQAEMEASTAAAAAKRKNVERRLKLPKDDKVKFLSQQLPQTKRSAA